MKKSTLWLAALALSVAMIFSLAPAALAADETAAVLAEAVVVKDETTLFKEEVLRLVNVERVSAGLKELVHNSDIQPLADLRALESSTLFSHTRPNNTKWSTVFSDNKIAFKMAGENLAAGSLTPEKVVKAWMNSPGHRANILDKDFTSIAVGFFKDASGKVFASQLFFLEADAK